MRRLAPITALLLAAGIAPTSTACYAPRIDSCRGALTSFDGIDEVSIEDAFLGGGFEQPSFVSFTVRAEASVDAGCIGVRSELWSDGVLDSVIETPVTAHREGGELVTSPVFHYRPRGGLMMVRVTTMGRTIEAPVRTFRDSLDAGARDGGACGAGDAGTIGCDAGLRDGGSRDGGARDGGGASDGGDDAGSETDAASEDDAGEPDGGTEDSGEGLDAG